MRSKSITISPRGITKENKLKKYQKKTNQFVNELESTLKDFENKSDVKELSSTLKESIKKFQMRFIEV